MLRAWRAFVPASQLAQHYVDKIEEFVGKEMELKIIEVDKQKKRIVASARLSLLSRRCPQEGCLGEP